MKRGYERELQRHARFHRLKLVRAWNVLDRFDVQLAKLAISEAAHVLATTTDKTAITQAMPCGVRVQVEKLPTF